MVLYINYLDIFKPPTAAKARGREERHKTLTNFEGQNPPLRFLSSDGRCGVEDELWATNELARPFLDKSCVKNFPHNF